MKNKLTLLIFVLTISLTFIVSSCKKDDESLSKKELLTLNKWKYSSFKYNGIAENLDICELDDIVIFSSNNTYSWNPTAVKCDLDEIIFTGNWTLSSDEKIFTFDGAVVTIVELSAKKLVISTLEDGDTLETTFLAYK